MFDITCLDKNKNVITRFTQWDRNQSITIEIDYEWTEAPEFHFCNKNSKEAIVVKSILSENSITAIVPDTLLQEASPIIVYIYEIDNISGRSVASIKIPVIPRLVPSNYSLTNEMDYKITIDKYIGAGTNIEIPTEINSIAVLKIGSGAFSETEVETVKIPEGVEEVE